jgi:hypothetical protein
MTATEFTKLCSSKGACPEGMAWIKGKSFAKFWKTCERADWMLWIVGRMAGENGWPTHQDIVLVSCLCAETALPIFEKKYPKDDRPRKAIEAARAWAKGDLDIKEVRKARRAAADAAYAAAAAAAAAHAADAAAAYAAAAAAYAYARADALRKMCAIVRENLKVPL